MCRVEARDVIASCVSLVQLIVAATELQNSSAKIFCSGSNPVLADVLDHVISSPLLLLIHA